MGQYLYVYLAYSFAINYFGHLLDLPGWLSKTSIQSWLPSMPTESFDLAPFVLITILSLALMGIGALGYSRRDMVKGV